MTTSADRVDSRGATAALPRRVAAALAAFVLAASVLAVVSSPASAAKRRLGPNVTRILNGRMDTYVNGALTGSYPLVEFGVRGNSSAKWPKKPYGLVFASGQTPLGLPMGKSFRLLANYHDRSLLRDRVSYDLAEKITAPRWSVHTAFTELYVGSRYRGSYLLVEEVTTTRVGLPSSTGLIAEYAADGYKFDSDGEKSKPHDPDSSSRMGRMVTNHVNPFLSDLRGGGSDWQDRINLDSFVDYYLIKEFTKDKDADFLFSNYYYTDDVDDPSAKMFMGPVWDFDRSAGNEKGITTSTVASPQGWWVRFHDRTAIDRATHPPHSKNNWYNRLVNKPAFNTALCQRWRATAPIFQSVATSGLASARASLGGARVAKNDRALWGRSAVERPPSRGSWGSEVRYLKRWYAKRFKWMNAHIC